MISDGILEAAYLTAGEDLEAWISLFEGTANKLLPDGVVLNLETCRQEGTKENFLPDDDFERLLSVAETEVDTVFEKGEKR